MSGCGIEEKSVKSESYHRLTGLLYDLLWSSRDAASLHPDPLQNGRRYTSAATGNMGGLAPET